MSDNIASIFQTTITKINLIIIATFFIKIYITIFVYLLVAGSIESGLFGLMSTYFRTMKTNRRDILHLHYLVWLKDILNLSNFCQKINVNPDDIVWLFHFFNHIIIMSLSVYFSKLFSKPDPSQDKFTLLLTIENIDAICVILAADSNKVNNKFQIHSLPYNTSYYKYGKSDSKCYVNIL